MKKQKTGISLIVLIITIVVMIILAATVILTLTGNGVISNANDAKNKTDSANLKAAATAAYSEWMTEYAKGSTTESELAYIANYLKSIGYTDEQIEKVYISSDGSIKVISSVASEIEALGVQIGAKVVGYNLETNTTTSYTTSTPINMDKKETISKPTTAIEWQYLGINEDGKALIIANNSVGTWPKLAIGGKNGYLNGPKELDIACNKMFSTNMGVARNIHLDDMELNVDYELIANEVKTLGQVADLSRSYCAAVLIKPLMVSIYLPK